MSFAITLRQVSVFVAIAQTGSTTAAAAQLSMSQSAISAALSELEHALSEKLFDRHGKRLYLNDLGRQLQSQAVALLDQAEAFVQGASSPGIFLRIAASSTIGNYVLPPLLAHFYTQHSDISCKLDVQIGNTQDVLTALHTFDADMGLIEGSCNAEDFKIEHWMNDNMLIVAAPAHPLGQIVQQRKLTHKELCEADWLVREQGSGTRELVESQIAAHIGPLKMTLELGNSEAIRRTIIAGHGISCLSEHVVEEAIVQGRLVNIGSALPALNRSLYLVTHRDKRPTRGLDIFLDYLRAAASRNNP